MTWGPWIEHDGKGCPCVGQLVQFVCVTDGIGHFAVPGISSGLTERTFEDIARDGGPWDWQNFMTRGSDGHLVAKTVRYRIRQFKALEDLKALIAEGVEA